jgi:hypothetical protein
MFRVLKNAPLEEAIDAAYYAMRALERRLGPDQLAKTRLMAGVWCEPGAKQQELAQHLLAEIESRERVRIEDLGFQELTALVGEVADSIQQLSETARPANRVNGRVRLEELRRLTA